jgi:hypothetical protein
MGANVFGKKRQDARSLNERRGTEPKLPGVKNEKSLCVESGLHHLKGNLNLQNRGLRGFVFESVRQLFVERGDRESLDVPLPVIASEIGEQHL